MAAVGRAGFGWLPRNFYRINGCQSLKLNYAYAAFFHNTSALHAQGLPIKMPSLSPTMMEGTIIKWLKKEGDTVQPGDILCDIQTDKAVVSLDVEDEGTLAKILVSGFMGFGEDDDSGSFMENLFEVHNQLVVNDQIEVSDGIPSQNANNFEKALPKFIQTKQIKENKIVKHQKQIIQEHERENEAESVSQSLSSDWSIGAEGEKIQNDITTMLESYHTIEHLCAFPGSQCSKSSASYEDEMPRFQTENFLCVAKKEAIVAEEDFVIPKESSYLQEYKREGEKILIVPLEAKQTIEPQSMNLSNNLIQIKVDNLKTSGANSQENSEYNEAPLQNAVAYSDNAKESKPINNEKEKIKSILFKEACTNLIHSSALVQTENTDTNFSESSYMHNSEIQEHETASSISSRAQPVEIRAVLQVPEDTKDVKVGTLIAVMVAEGEDWKTVIMPSEDLTQSGAQPVTAPTPATVSDADHGNYGPSVRLLLEQYGLSASQVPAGGPHGKLLKGDVLNTIKERNLQPLPLLTVAPPEALKPAAAPGSPTAPTSPTVPRPLPITGISEDGFYDIEVTSMRRTIAKRLTQSKGGIAHSYGTIDCCVDKLLALRKQYKEEGINVSVNDLIIKAVAVALNRCPEMNCVWRGDQLMIANQVDISIAVATPAGLITTIIHGADTLGVEDIATKVRDLAGRARENKLKLDEFQGGTFTISNLGMFGISEFSAIINPPQCGILAIGGSRLSLGESGTSVTYMCATLSYDRVGVDDDTAAAFLDTVKQLLEDPNTMMLGAYTSSVNHPMAALL